MANGNAAPTHGLAIYLLKENIADPQIAVQGPQLVRHEIRRGRRLIGNLYVQRGRPRPPRWAKFFDGYVDRREFGQVSSAAAVLLVSVRDRIFALTFGQGRHLLNPDSWEERFGLRVALNSIGETNVRSIDKRTFDAISRHSKEQASREASARDFSLDIEQDLLRAITGTPTDSDLGKRMSGMDALHTAVPVALDSVSDLLGLYLDKFGDTSYRVNFPWVDHISEVSNGAFIEQLDRTIAERIASNHTDRIWMAVPEVIPWERVDGFVWQGRNAPRRHDVNLAGFIRSVPDLANLSVQQLKHRRVSCLEHDGRVFDSWSAYRCLHAEVEHEGMSYLLSGGKWYRLSVDFVQEVNQTYDRIPRYAHEFLPFGDASEGAYNARIVATNPTRYALMDQRNIMYGGSRSRIEFCDMLVDRRDIVHIKRYGAASVLSHLFSQGLVSGELFQTDVEFRRLVNEELPAPHRLRDINSRPAQDEYQVVFAVISDIPGELSLPFFSRLNLKHAARRLAGYGYRVSIAKIPVDDIYRLTERYE